MSGQEEGETKQHHKRYATTGTDKNRLQLEKLMKDPSKPVVLPTPPKEKTVRAPREMMKSVQGSSAGAGSGEFHVYKANRRREYERLKIMEEQKLKEELVAETERKKREREEVAEAKTAKNRAKRQKRKEAARKGKEKGSNATGDRSTQLDADSSDSDSEPTEGQPFKKRRLVAQPTPGWDKGEDMNTDSNANPNIGGNVHALGQNPDAISLGQVEDASQAINVVIHDED